MFLAQNSYPAVIQMIIEADHSKQNPERQRRFSDLPKIDIMRHSQVFEQVGTEPSSLQLLIRR